jgi:pyrroloquinoline quinone biosynthesis protein E
MSRHPKALPRHAAESIPGLQFRSVRDRSLTEILFSSPAFNASRGTERMRERCRSCSRKEMDFGGCRCQTMALAGDPREVESVRHLSPRHGAVADLAGEKAVAADDVCLMST